MNKEDKFKKRFLKQNGKNDAPAFEIDKTGLIMLAVMGTLAIIFVVMFIKGDMAERQTYYNSSQKISICDEIDKENSKIVKHSGDMVFINGKSYKYLDIKVNCEIKKQNGSTSN